MKKNVGMLIALYVAKIGVERYGDSMEGAFQAMQNMKSLIEDAATIVRILIDEIKKMPNNPFGDDEEALAGYLLEVVLREKDEK